MTGIFSVTKTRNTQLGLEQIEQLQLDSGKLQAVIRLSMVAVDELE